MSKQITAAGWTVTFRHQQFTPVIQRKLKRRARTTCYLTLRDGDAGLTVFGVAECSLKDKFSKHKGRALALARALAIVPSDRTAIAAAYVNRT